MAIQAHLVNAELSNFQNTWEFSFQKGAWKTTHHHIPNNQIIKTGHHAGKYLVDGAKKNVGYFGNVYIHSWNLVSAKQLKKC
jgi:hypothetical protein